jgi:hypothetical protein
VVLEVGVGELHVLLLLEEVGEQQVEVGQVKIY